MKKVNKSEKKDIKIDQILLLYRNVFVYDTIDESLAFIVNKQLLALDRLNDKPIYMWINSRGGQVSSGLSIIDTMSIIKSNIITIISGTACSMAGILSINGDARLMTKNAVWMAHDMTSGDYDYTTKLMARTDYYKELQKDLFNIIRKKTKLSEIEIQKAIHEELWLNTQECLKKGIIDKIWKGKHD